MLNLFLAASVADGEYIPYIIIWSVLIVIGTLCFAIVIYFNRRFFFYKAVTMFYNEGKKRVKEVKFCKIGTLVDVSKLPINRKYKHLVACSILSDGNISKGNLQAFIMPDRDVSITFVLKQEKEKQESFSSEQKKLTLALPKEVKELSDSLVRPLLLLSKEDIISHIEESNSHFAQIPLYNSYRCSVIEDRDVLVLYNDRQIYGLCICSEAVVKLILRIDDAYVRHQLSDIDTCVKEKGDIWTMVVDSSFDSVQRIYDILDRAYTYVLLTDFVKTMKGYIRKDEEGDRFNSHILAFNEEISRSFDPVYDRVIIEGQKYKEQLVGLFLTEKRLDVPFITPKDLIYEELEKIDDKLLAEANDGFVKPEFLDTEKDRTRFDIQPDIIPDVKETLSDLLPVQPSDISIQELIDFIMNRKDMVSLTIEVSSDYALEPTSMRFLTQYFCLINKGKYAYALNLRYNPKKIKNLIVRHPNITHVKSGEDMEWFRFTLDQTYLSIDELYQIVLDSYEFTKEEYYAADESLDREAEFKPSHRGESLF